MLLENETPLKQAPQNRIPACAERVFLIFLATTRSFDPFDFT
jgi:hypothetical protein